MFEANKDRFVKDESILSELELQKIELQKERQKFFDQRNAYKRLLRERARQEELNEIIYEAVSALPSLDYYPRTPYSSNNDLLISLNDLHYGAVCNNSWNLYDSDVCKKRMKKYLDRIISIRKTHNSEKCIVWANGDLIAGNIHHEISVTNKENVIEQVVGVSQLISDFLVELSKHFRCVSFVTVAGNHSRLDTKERSLKDERLDDLVEWYVKARLQNFDNVFIGDCDKLDTSMYLMNIRGKNYLGVHGDYDGSETKVQSLRAFVREPIYAVLSGHLHHNKLDTVQGIKTVMAGSFLGVDSFCISKRIFGEPQQLVCVCTDDGIECSYDINFD